MSKKEVYISVDIETAGPIVGEHSMLSIGACFVYNPHIEFAIMLQPISDKAIEEALKVALDYKEKNAPNINQDESQDQFAAMNAYFEAKKQERGR